MHDHEGMQLAIACAHTAEGRTSPRPPVGAIVVRDGRVIGRGATSPPYGPHAEIHALNAAGPAARGADLYVTLEPCCVTIHTPPCTDAIIAAGIQRVVVGSHDPNPRVYEQGVAQLRAAGIEVVTGVAEDQTVDLIRPFATLVTQNRPYVTAKWAMTLDGKLASRSGDSRWISSAASRTWVHNLRDRVDAIMVGAQTARTDDPQLTVRLAPEDALYQRAPRPGPARIVLATHGNLPANLKLFQPELVEQTCVIVGSDCADEQYQALCATGVDVLRIAVNVQGQIDLPAAMAALAAKGFMHILLEGGAQLLGAAFDCELIDHVAVFIAPKLIGGVSAPSPLAGQGIASMPAARRLQHVRSQTFDDDLLIEGDIIPDNPITTN